MGNIWKIIKNLPPIVIIIAVWRAVMVNLMIGKLKERKEKGKIKMLF